MTLPDPSQDPALPANPVSSLRHKFEQLAASSSSPSLSPSHGSRFSNAGQQEYSTVSKPSDSSGSLNIPVLHSSLSSPEINGARSVKPTPPPPPPRGNRTPSPSPSLLNPPTLSPREPVTQNANESTPLPSHKKSAPFSRRPPPPPPVKPVNLSPEQTITQTSEPPASPRTKFSASPVRSVSASHPPALPARPNDQKISSIKGTRPSLPSLSTLPSDPFPSRDSALLRSPPPVPSKTNSELFPKVANSNGTESTSEQVSPDTVISSESSSSVENWTTDPPKCRAHPRSCTSLGSPNALPPPLPPRRNASDEAEESTTRELPHLPRRRSFDTHPYASSKLPSRMNGIIPPPARSIGLKDKLPPARRPSSDSEDSDTELASTEIPMASTSRLTRALEGLPDSTHCSRRPPQLSNYKFAKARVHVPGISNVVAFAGSNVIVSSHNYLKIYDILIGHAPMFTIDIKDLPIDWRVKDPRITAMEFRAGEGPEAGNFLWCGSKDGHLWEFDVARRAIVCVRSAAHGNAVTNIIRHGRSLITLDESGKVLTWKDYEDLSLGGQPRVARVVDKQGFVKMFGELLWTSNGPGNAGGFTGAQRSPTIRVYDILAPNSTAKIITPPDTLGAVTSGTVLPSQPHLVYLGHEGGYITIWAVNPAGSPSIIMDKFDSGRAVPVCVQVVKISASDVLALEGVVDKLWAGSRMGIVSAYDVQTKPWKITNSWQAHEELPILKLSVDPFSIDKCEQLHVVSVGRDEALRFWDGLLATDWTEGQLHMRETEFSSFRDIKVLICSWNTDAQKPDTLTGNADNVNFLEEVLHSVDGPDIVVFGFQELIDLENRKLTAKTVLLGAQNKKNDGTISEKVSRSYRMWHERLVQAVRIAMPIDDPYVVAHTDNLVGLFSCIFVRQRHKHLLRDSVISKIKRGMGGKYGNKGAIVSRFVIDDSSLCFINCHLAAGQSHIRSRNQDIAAILEDTIALPHSELPEALPYVGGGDGTMILDHEICFLGGDLNYRIGLRRDAVVSAVNSGELESLINHDQLKQQAKNNPAFRLRHFIEAPISFAPTYKYDRRSNTYDTSEKKRVPAWCDRILYRCRDDSRVQTLHYRRYETNVSDHRPISAAFRVTVKSIRHEQRHMIKAQIGSLWKEHSLVLLFNMREFYSARHLL